MLTVGQLRIERQLIGGRLHIGRMVEDRCVRVRRHIVDGRMQRGDRMMMRTGGRYERGWLSIVWSDVAGTCVDGVRGGDGGRRQ